MTRWIVLAVATVALAILRIVGVKHEAFQAVAHLFVGGLAGAWLVRRDLAYLGMFVVLCVVEVVCFLADRLL